MIYVISKETFGDYNVHDIQCNSTWCECVLDGYVLIPDNLVESILATRGYCDIVLNDDGTEVVSFTAREIPEVPEACDGHCLVVSVNGINADHNGDLTLPPDSTKQNQLAWLTSADLEAMWDGTYVGIEDENPASKQDVVDQIIDEVNEHIDDIIPDIVDMVMAALPEYDGTVIVGGGASLITFNIGVGFGPYQAEEGMTWGEWVESEYNTDGWYANNNSIVRVYATYGVNDVTSTDVIVNGTTYTYWFEN